MKTLMDGTEVTSRSYYFLLDWNEQDYWSFIKTEFGKLKLSELTKSEYKRLFNKATTHDLNNI